MNGTGVPSHPGLEALEDAFYMVDGEWSVTYWNAAAARIFGVAPAEALGRSLWEVLPSFRDEPTGEELLLAMDTRLSRRFLMPHLPGCCPGTYAVRTTALEGGGLTAQIREATEETQLSQRYVGLLESIRDGFVAVDADGTILYVNQVAERLLRLPRGGSVGKAVWPLLPIGGDEIEEAVRASLADARSRRLRRIRFGGEPERERFFEVWFFPLSGGGLSIFFQDVSKNVRRERELARFAADAEEANRAKARFFAAVSHELRTPLNALVGYTHLLSTDTYGELPPGAARAATRSSVCAEHLARLIDDVLLMTTAEIDRHPVEPVPVLLSEFLPRAVEPIRQQAESKGLSFSIELATSLDSVETDPDRLRQLLQALLSNAVKFTSQGEVRLEVYPDTSAGTPRGDAENRHIVVFRVVDTGPGIPEDARDRVFEAFEKLGDPARSDSMYQGPGLGLTLARRLAELLGGSLELETGSQAGTRVSLLLPRSTAPARLGTSESSAA
jgi:signal transduction histidine kinase